MAQTINLDTAQRVDIICRKGDTFSLNLSLTAEGGAIGFANTDSFKMQVRESDDSDTVLANTAEPPVNFEIDVAISGEPADATVNFTLSASDMKTMPSGEYVYDIEHTSGTDVKTLIYGVIRINEDVTEAV